MYGGLGMVNAFALRLLPLLRYDLLQPFQDIVNSRADSRVQVRGVNVFKKIARVRVWVFAAVTGAGIVDRAVVVRAEERAWAPLHYIVTVFIQAQVALYQVGLFDAEVFCYARYIRSFESWRDILAAACTGQAVYLSKRFLVQLRQFLLYAALSGSALQVLAVLLALVGRFFLPVV